MLTPRRFYLAGGSPDQPDDLFFRQLHAQNIFFTLVKNAPGNNPVDPVILSKTWFPQKHGPAFAITIWSGPFPAPPDGAEDD